MDYLFFFGIEYSLVQDINHMSKAIGTDFILLNVTKEWLAENKAAFSGKPAELFAKIHEVGGFVIHAHPFLESNSQLLPRNVDAVEVLNAGCTDFVNHNAQTYARTYGLLETAGSDCHKSDQKILTGLETPTLCLSLGELIATIRNHEARPFSIIRDV